MSNRYTTLAQEFHRAFKKLGVESDVTTLRAQIAWLDSHGMAQIEVQRMHEANNHPYAGSHRCLECLSRG